MRKTLTLFLICLGGTASAHPGHWAELAGHDHWAAGAAIGLAILLGLRGAMKGRKSEEPAEEEEAEQVEEAAA